MERQDLTNEPGPEPVTTEEEKRLEMLVSHFRPGPAATGDRQRVLEPALEALARRQRFVPLTGMWQRMFAGSRGVAAMAAGILALFLCFYAVDLHYQNVIKRLSGGPPPQTAELDAAVAQDLLNEVLPGTRLNRYAKFMALRSRMVVRKARTPERYSARKRMLDELLKNGG